MKIINKNKEEIEKFGRVIVCDDWDCPACQRYRGQLEERIKTSILWCEDEIERIKKLRLTLMYVKDKHKEGLKKVWNKENKQLQTHLTWLKEQEKEWKN